MGAACRRRGGAGNLIAPRPPGGRPERREGGSDFRCPRSRRRDAQARWAAQRTSRGVHAGTGEAGLRTRPSRRVRVEPRRPSWVSPGAAPSPPPLPLHVGVGWMDPPRVRSLTSLAEVPWPAWVCLTRWRRWGGLAGRASVAAATGPPRGSASSRSSASPGEAVLEAPRSPPGTRPGHPPGSPPRTHHRDAPAAPVLRSLSRGVPAPRAIRAAHRMAAGRPVATGAGWRPATAAGSGRRHHRGGPLREQRPGRGCCG